ncbi:MAG: hypothetical protein V7L21_35020 [Nostoc sp.]|nr:hypothetical protein [Nostoc sp. NMS9]
MSINRVIINSSPLIVLLKSQQAKLIEFKLWVTLVCGYPIVWSIY